MLQVKKIQKSYGSMTVLADVSFNLAKGQKVALVGDNGTGKTTLLKIVAGLESADSGEVKIGKYTSIGYLPQDTSLTEHGTIKAYLRKVVGIDMLEDKLEELVGDLADETKAAQYGDLQDQYERLGGYSFEHRMKIMLSGFGLNGIQIEDDISELSSGQKSKVALVGILLKGIDLLLLDEPTNNLDLPALIWLEDFLRKSEAACIVISHDRRFLDRTVKKIFELDRLTKSLNVSNGTYSDYLENASKRLARHKEQYRLQQEEISRLTEQARQQRVASARGSSWAGSDNDKFLRGFKRDRAGRSSRVAKTLEKRIDLMDKVEKPVEREPFEIPLDAAIRPGNQDIVLTDVVIGYSNGFKIGPVSFEARFGQRVGIMGLNGSGKSTLLKALTGQIMPISGTVEIGSGIRVGNMMQEHQTLPRDQVPLEFLQEKANLDLQGAYAKLARFGFEERQAKQPIRVLSPGGRARLLLALFSALSVNALVLDEPTNHLDLEALQALEETLSAYRGTVLLVTHDRYFLEKARLDSTYLLSEGALKKIPDYKVYVAQAEDRAQQLLKTL